MSEEKEKIGKEGGRKSKDEGQESRVPWRGEVWWS